MPEQSFTDFMSSQERPAPAAPAVQSFGDFMGGGQPAQVPTQPTVAQLAPPVQGRSEERDSPKGYGALKLAPDPTPTAQDRFTRTPIAFGQTYNAPEPNSANTSYGTDPKYTNRNYGSGPASLIEANMGDDPVANGRMLRHESIHALLSASRSDWGKVLSDPVLKAASKPIIKILKANGYRGDDEDIAHELPAYLGAFTTSGSDPKTKVPDEYTSGVTPAMRQVYVAAFSRAMGKQDPETAAKYQRMLLDTSPGSPAASVNLSPGLPAPDLVDQQTTIHAQTLARILTPPPIAPAPTPYGLQTDQQQIAEAPTFRNPRTGVGHPRQEPGKERGPLSVLDTPITGARHSAEGVEQMAEPGIRAKAGGLHKVIGGVLETATPLMVGAGAVAPLATAATLATGTVAQAGTEAVLKKIGIPEEYAAVAGDLVGLFAAAKTPKTIAALKAKYEPVLRARLEKAKAKAGVPEASANSTGTAPYRAADASFDAFMKAQAPPVEAPAQPVAAPAADPARKRLKTEKYSEYRTRMAALDKSAAPQEKTNVKTEEAATPAVEPPAKPAEGGGKPPAKPETSATVSTSSTVALENSGQTADNRPTSGASDGKRAASVSEVDAGATRPLDAGRAGEGPAVHEPPGASQRPGTGEATDVLIPGEARSIPAHYAVRELSEIQSSHHGQTFSANPNYGLENERDYSKPENQQRVIEQSAEGENGFQPRYHITDNPDMANGPVLIDEHGNAIGGNSRTTNLQRVYGRDGQKAAEYRALLEKKAPQFGIDPEVARGMRQPVLVRVASQEGLNALPTGAKWAIRKTNVQGQAALSSSERAAADASQMSPEMIGHIAGAIEDAGPDATLNDALTGKSGTVIVNRLIGDGFFSEQERPALMDGKTGAVTQSAKDRISKALLGKFFRDSDQISRTPAAIRNKLERVAAPLSKVAGNPQWDLTPEVQEAIDLTEFAGVHGIRNLSDVVSQTSLFGEGSVGRALASTAPRWSDGAVKLAEMLRDGKPNEVVAAFRKYVNSKEPTMFGESTPAEAFRDAFGAEKPERRAGAAGTTPPARPPEAAQAAAGGEAESGPHGPVLRQFRHDAAGAIAALRNRQSGDAIGALHHPELGDIDLIWGKSGDPANDFKGGYGLAHIDAKHPGIAEQLDRIIPSLEKGELQGHNRQVLIGKDHRAVVGLDWSDLDKRWLLTAYKEESPSSEGFSGGSERASAKGPATPSQGNSPGSSIDGGGNYTESKQRLNELLDRQYEEKRISEATYRRIRGSGGEHGEPPEGGNRGGSGGGGSEPPSGTETPPEKSGVKPATPTASGSPTYLASGLGAFEPFLRESIEDMRALKAKRDAAIEELERSKITPGEKKWGEQVRHYFTGERDLWAARANQGIARVRKLTFPSRNRRTGVDGLAEAISIAREFKGNPDELKSILGGYHPELAAIQDPAEYTRVMDRIRKLQPAIERALAYNAGKSAPDAAAMKAADRFYTNMAEMTAAEGKRTGAMTTEWNPERYVPHVLNPKGEGVVATARKAVGQAMGGRIGKYFGFSQERSYPTLLHAIMHDVIPKTMNVHDAFTIQQDHFARARATRLLEDQLRDTDVGKYTVKKSAPEGWVKLAPQADEFQQLVPYDTGAIDEAGQPVLDTATKRLYVPKFIEAGLRPITSPDFTTEILAVHALRITQAATKAAQLGLSLFHATTENYMALANMGVRGFAKALRADRDSAEFLLAERDLIAHGGTTSIQGNTVEAYKAMQPGSIPTYGDIWRQNAAVKIMDQAAHAISDFTFANMQRRFKVTDYQLHTAAWMAEHPHVWGRDLTMAKQSIAKEVNAIYGGLHWENIGVNKATVEIARAVMLAPDWTLSNIFNVKYALEKGPGGNMARMFWVRTLVGGIVATQAASLMFSRGHFSKRPTMVYMGHDSNGEEIYQNIFFKGAPGDATNLVTNIYDYGLQGIARSIAGKGAPVIRTGIQLIGNRDYLGHTIAPKGMNPVASSARTAYAAGKSMLPVPLSLTNQIDMLFGPESHKYTWPERLATMFAGNPPSHVAPSGTHMSNGVLRPNADREKNSVLDQAEKGQVYRSRSGAR